MIRVSLKDLVQGDIFTEIDEFGPESFEAIENASLEKEIWGIHGRSLKDKKLCYFAESLDCGPYGPKLYKMEK